MVYFVTVCEFLLLAITVNCVSSLGNYTLPDFHFRCCKQRYVRGEVTAEVRMLQSVKDAFSTMKQTLHILVRFYNELKSSVPDPIAKLLTLEMLDSSFAMLRRISNLWPPRLSLIKMAFGRLVKNPELGSFVNFVSEELYPIYISGGNKADNLYYPVNTRTVWRSAMTGVVRLQETYNLSTADLAAGGPPAPSGVVNNTVLSARDCYDIGVYCMEVGVPIRAKEWLLEASCRAVEYPGVSVTTINEYLQVAYCYTGDSIGYGEMVRKLLNEPYFIPTEDLSARYGDMVSLSCEQLKKIYVVDPFSQIVNRDNLLSVVQQKSLCRKGNTKLIATDKNLKCRMIHYNRPYLRIGPLKMEEQKIDPPVLVFHQVSHDTEMKALINESYRQMKPAFIYNGPGFKKYHDTQYNSWLHEKNSSWNQKSAMIANIGLFSSAPPMVGSYGLAGELRMHLDSGPEGPLSNKYSRADYVTLMYWLNQPDEGGFTVFPHLDLAIAPVKGSAVLWFNRHPTWDRDMRTLHSGCPILTGSKWILTKWFHVLDQAFPKCVPGKEWSRQYYYLDSNIE